MPTRREQYNAHKQSISQAVNQVFGDEVLSGPNLVDIVERNIVRRNETEEVTPGPGVGCTTIKYTYDRNYEFRVAHQVIVITSFNLQTMEYKTRSFFLLSPWMPVTDEHVEETVIECPGVFDLEIPKDHVSYEEETISISSEELSSYKKEDLIFTDRNGVTSVASLGNYEIINEGLNSRLKLSLKNIKKI